MNEELLYLENDEDVLEHYGMPRRSGRYPWGSGEDPFSHEKFDKSVELLKKEGLSEKEIWEEFNMKSTEYRALKSIVSQERRRADVERAIQLHDNGYSNVAIGKIMGKNESSIRSLLDPEIKARKDKAQKAADILRECVGENNYIDIGVGSEYSLGVSNTMLKTSVAILKEEGYGVSYINVEQMGTGKKTTVKVLTPPGTTTRDVYKNMDRIKPIEVVQSPDGDKTKNKYGFQYPSSVDPSRIYIRYMEDGGIDKDGVIELRKNVPDLQMGNSAYAQVRIAVNGTHYLKGMAMYSDNIPDGYDILFNTNKKKGTPMIDTESPKKDNCVLKPLKEDKDNPFGAALKIKNGQRDYIDPSTGETKLSCVNIVNEEGDWNTWSRTLSAQMLAKQSMALIQRQLDLSYADKKAEFDEIMSLTNPTIKKKLLESFADDCDASAVSLKAASLPRQASHVILPVPELKDDEIYAPKYKDGETVALIRYPHGGTFEIPELRVNNKNKAGISTIGPSSPDAVGINPRVASTLSGADFDGDTVLVIPCNSSTSNVHLTTSKSTTSEALKKLQEFDPKTSYGKDAFPGQDYKVITTDKAKGQEMGKITNLITDMTLKGADGDEIARAVRHSMVIIDSKKHKLNYLASYNDNNIAELQLKYQGKAGGGSATLISKAKSPYRVDDREEGVLVVDPETGSKKKIYHDPVTGEKLYTPTGETYSKKIKDPKTGEVSYKEVKRQSESTKMYETKDAYTLSSGLPQEEAYAEYANKLKALGNQSRLEYDKVPRLEKDPSASLIYKEEINSLNAKLLIALKNAPRERQAQILANEVVKSKIRANPDMEKDELKKVKGQALAGARVTVGAQKERVHFTDKEWEAIQNGSISDSKLSQLLDNADLDEVKKLAMPKNDNSLSDAKISQLIAKSNSGYTIQEIAESMGISENTVVKYLKGGE